MKAGDKVFHRPSGERWILACAEFGKVYPEGWPCSLAGENDCELFYVASYEEYINMLEKWAKHNDADIRTLICRHQLLQEPQAHTYQI